MRINLIPLLLFIVLCSGCAGRGDFGSFLGVMPEQSAAALIASDAVDCLSASYPPGHTSLHVLSAKKADNRFAAAFEDGLRAHGFTLASSDTPEAITVAYTLDELEEGAFYLQLRLSDGYAMARAYFADGQPQAGRSQTPFVFKMPVVQRAAKVAKEKTNRALEAISGGE